MTLIEILLALVVMVLGVVGILALFPPALQSSMESVEDNVSAMVGESVAHALDNSIRFARFVPATSDYEVTFAHDLAVNGKPLTYRFRLPHLPKTAGIVGPPDLDWWHFPGAMPPANPDPGKKITISAVGLENDNCHFGLGGDRWTDLAVQNVHNVNDPTDPYEQFAFSFDIAKVNSLQYLNNPIYKNPATNPLRPYTPQEIDAKSKLFEVRIHILRTAKQMGTMSGGGGTTTTGSGSDVRRYISTVVKRFSVD
jgi:type II secretory pathway pseudopilin PulG